MLQSSSCSGSGKVTLGALATGAEPMRTTAVLTLLSLVATSCVSTATIVRKRFSTEYGCPASRVDVSSDSATRYHASGCDEAAVYVCGTFTSMNRTSRDCVEESVLRSPAPAERDRPVLPPPDPRVKMP